MTLQDTITAPEIRSIGAYDFPSKSAQHRYGDDQLIMVWWKGNPWFVAAACFRAPKAMSWADFWNGLFVPYHSEDPDFDAGQGWEQFDWVICGESRTPRAEDTLEGLGATHKGVIAFTSRS